VKRDQHVNVRFSIGLIGPGRHGERYLYRKNGAYPAVVMRSEAKQLEALPAGHDVKTVCHQFSVFCAYADAAIIATPPDTHRELAIQCMRLGMPCLIEKPLALTWADCQAIDAVSKETGVPYMVGHTHIYSAAFTPPGEVLRLTGTHGGPDGHDYSPLLDWGPHLVSMAIRACGAPRSWEVVRRNDEGSYEIQMEHFRGAKSHLLVGWFSERRGPSFTATDGDGKTWQYRPSLRKVARTPMDDMVRKFLKVCRKEELPPNDEELMVYRVLMTKGPL
jgi:hypothetical protein